MYSGIKIKVKAILSTIIEGIEVNSSILSEAFETSNANMVIGIGRSLDCHLFIEVKNNPPIGGQINVFSKSFPIHNKF